MGVSPGEKSGRNNQVTVRRGSTVLSLIKLHPLLRFMDIRLSINLSLFNSDVLRDRGEVELKRHKGEGGGG